METLPRVKKFEKTMERLIELVVLGRAHLQIGRGIAKLMTEDPVIRDVARVFWGMSITAHLDAAQMFAFKLFDPRNGSMTIPYLLERAKECSADFQKATPEQVSALALDANRDILAIAAALKPLRAKRNRILAHVDPTIVCDPEKLEAETKITFGDLDGIFGTAGKILNNVSVAFRDNSSILEIMGAADYQGAVPANRGRQARPG